jgi:hypothetical protein
MTAHPDNGWAERLDKTLDSYDVAALRTIAERLCSIAIRLPAETLRQQIATALRNAPLIDRRLRELAPAAQQLLQMLARYGRCDWDLASLTILVGVLGAGIDILQTLADLGFLMPVNEPEGRRRHSIPLISVTEDMNDYSYFVPPSILNRARLVPPSYPRAEVQTIECEPAEILESDGWEIPLRLAAAWQMLLDPSFRFKFDRNPRSKAVQRAKTDPILNGPFVAAAGEPLEMGFLIFDWAKASGLIIRGPDHWLAGPWPLDWRLDLPHLLASLWRALPKLWIWSPEPSAGLPRSGMMLGFRWAYPLILSILADLAPKSWVKIDDLARWSVGRFTDNFYPVSKGNWIENMVWSVLFPLRIVQAARYDDEWIIRLSALGRWLAGDGPSPTFATTVPKPILVQPNYDVLVLRDGLTPSLLAEISSIGEWQSLGSACVMRLTEQSVYRGLELGREGEQVLQFLSRHSARELPDNVVASIRSWSRKRDRILVYSDATVVEFLSASDTDEALRRGLIDVKLSDHFGLIRDENRLDYRQIRLLARRNFDQPPEPCLTVAEDGLEIRVDLSRSDLMLEVDLHQIAELIEIKGVGKRFRLTRQSLQRALANGWTHSRLDSWFRERSGFSLSAAGTLLALPDGAISLQVRNLWVVSVNDPWLAAGLIQWPNTRHLIQEQLSPTTFTIAAKDLPLFQQALAEIGQQVEIDRPEVDT